MAIMPGASRVQKFSGNRHKRAVSKIVLHTTEGSSWPGYGGGGSAPHFTVHRDGTIRQHIDTAYSAKALVNRRGGVETNNGGAIQIEFIGSCDKSWARKHGLFFIEDATDADLAGLAKVLAWINKTHGVPLTATGLKWPTSNAAYRTAPQRMSYSQWNNYRGVCGHTHVPENDHWDPGNFPITRLLNLANGAPTVVPGKGASVSAGKPAVKPSTSKAPAFPLPRRKGELYYYGPADGPRTSVSGRGRNSGAPGDVVMQAGRWYSKGLKMWQQRMLDRGWSGIGAADGRYGPKTEKVIRQFQASKGLGVDGKIGPGTWAAAWTEPVK